MAFIVVNRASVFEYTEYTQMYNRNIRIRNQKTQFRALLFGTRRREQDSGFRKEPGARIQEYLVRIQD